MKRLLVAVFATAALSASLLSTPTAQAVTAPQPAPDKLVASATATVQYYLPDDTTLVGTSTYGDATQGQAMKVPAAITAKARRIASRTGSGGTSTASGCARVTVRNVETTFLGFTAYSFNTWTHWCWTRSNQNIYDIDHGFNISDVNATYWWKGINKDTDEWRFYDYAANNGYPRSALKNYMQGQFDNCVVDHGCILTFYPANLIRSYYNGTWVWGTDGDAT